MTYNVSENWSAYCGFGGGVSYMDLSVNSIAPPLGLVLSASGSSRTEMDGVIQAKVGLRYKLSDQSDFGIGYKYMDVLNTSYGTDVATHLFLLEYNLRF